MLGSASMEFGNMPAELRAKAHAVCSAFEAEVREQVAKRGLPPVLFPAVFPCNLLCIADRQSLHVVFSNINAGGVPNHTWLDRSNDGPFFHGEVVKAGIEQFGLVTPSSFALDIRKLDLPENERKHAMSELAAEYVETCVKLATRPRAILGYEGLQPYLDAFSSDHPDFENNVFLAMRFRSGKQFGEIHTTIKDVLGKYGLKTLRADDKTYPPDGDLWNNVCTYMMGCKRCVCVFEEIDDRDFNPNVPLEYGFMRAMNRQVLLLKDMRMPKLPSDMTGKLYRHFDTYNIQQTISEQTEQWVERDLGRRRTP